MPASRDGDRRITRRLIEEALRRPRLQLRPRHKPRLPQYREPTAAPCLRCGHWLPEGATYTLCARCLSLFGGML